MHKSIKILVIGASIAGPTLCYWLKRYGFSPTLIEKHPTIRQGGYAVDIRGIATDVTKRMGIYNVIAEMRRQLAYARYVDDEGSVLFESHEEEAGFRSGDDVEIVRGDLVKILMNSISDVPCHFSQTVKKIHQHHDHVLVEFENGESEYYDIVIGTDGLHSTLRDMAFDATEYELFNLGSYLSFFSIPNYLNLSHGEILYEKNHKLAHITSDKPPDEAIAGFMFQSQHILKNIRDEKEQKNFLNTTFLNMGWEVNRMLDLMTHAKDFYFDIISQVKMKSWTKDRIALVGDSAFCPSPLSGQGTSLAIVGAYVLAGELHSAGGDHVKAFKRYNEIIKPYVEANQDFGLWASQSFLGQGDIGHESAKQKSNEIIDRISRAANSIKLPIYPEASHLK